MRDTSAITRSGGSIDSAGSSLCPGRAASSFARKKRSTPASSTLAISASVKRTAVTVESDAGPWTARFESSFQRGLDLIRSGEFFAAHEELELEWRAATPEERDFFQGLVHVAVAWYQAGRGNRTGCSRQLEKATRRLSRYAPVHRGVDVAALLEQVARARARVDAGSLELEPQTPSL